MGTVRLRPLVVALTTLVAALNVPLSLAAPASAAAPSSGYYDTSFGSGGTAPAEGHILAAQGDKILAGDHMGMHRYLSDGQLDKSFGVMGRLDRPENMYLTYKGGAILAVGTRDGRPAVQRFTPDGRPDPSFNGGLVATTSHQGFATDAIAQGSKVVLHIRKDSTWTHEDNPVWEDHFSGVLTRLDSLGRVDATFGANGETPSTFVAHVPFPVTFGVGLVMPDAGVCHPSVARCWFTMGAAVISGGIVKHGDGFIFTASKTVNGIRSLEMRRITASGILDPSFSPAAVTSGLVQVQPEGSIYVAGRLSGGTLQVQKLLATGHPDATFGPDGRASVGVPHALSVSVAGFAVTPSGLVVAGHRYTGGTWSGYLLRTDDRLAPQPSFAVGGFMFKPWDVFTGLIAEQSRFITSAVREGGSILSAFRSDIPAVIDNNPAEGDFAYTCGDVWGYSYRTCSFEATASDPDGDAVVVGWSTGYGNATVCHGGQGYGPWGNKMKTTGVVAVGQYCFPVVTLYVEDAHGELTKISKKLEFGPSQVTAPLTLTATSSKDKGVNRVRLEWNDPVSSFTVYRDGTRIAGGQVSAYTDEIGKGSAAYVYKVCRGDDTTKCSNDVTVKS